MAVKDSLGTQKPISPETVQTEIWPVSSSMGNYKIHATGDSLIYTIITY